MESNIKKNIQITNQVRKLIQMHLNRAMSYQQAMSLTSNQEVKTLLEQGMQQSYYFVEHLQSAMAMQGLSLHAKPSLSGTLFRAWMTLSVHVSNRKSYRIVRCLLAAEKTLNLSYKLLCTNRYLQYAYPLLKSTFLKQYFSIKDYMGLLEQSLERLKDMADLRNLEKEHPIHRAPTLPDNPESPNNQDQDPSAFSLREKILQVMPETPTVTF